jgi:hypothetical protein
MAYTVTMENSGGILDSRTVQRERDIKAALLEMLTNGPAELFAGDVFRVYRSEEAPQQQDI